MKNIILLFFLSSILFTSFCAREDKDQIVSLKWIGCDVSKKAFMQNLADEYEKRYGAKIILEGGGDIRGIREVSAGRADMGGACRYKLDTPEEENALMVPIAWDALVIIVNLNNPVENLSEDQVRQIFLGEITNWKDVGGDDQPIEVCVRENKNSGVGRMGRQLIFKNGEQDYTDQAKIFVSTGPLETEIEKNPKAIGITGVSSGVLSKVRMLRLNNVPATKENIINNSYPYSRPLYIVFNKKYDTKLIHFKNFAWGPEGQKIISEAGTVNLAEGAVLKEIYKKEMEGFNTLEQEPRFIWPQ